MRSADLHLWALLVFGWLAAAGCVAPTWPGCRNDPDCQRSWAVEYCVDARCAPCRDDSHCEHLGRNRVCESGECVVVAGYCDLEDYPCPTGRRCSDNRCVPDCLDDHNCPLETECKDQRCVPIPRCVTHADCPPDEYCVGEVGATLCVSGPVDVEPLLSFDFDEVVLTLTHHDQLDGWSHHHRYLRQTDQPAGYTGFVVHCVSAATDVGRRRLEVVIAALEARSVSRDWLHTSPSDVLHDRFANEHADCELDVLFRPVDGAP